MIPPQTWKQRFNMQRSSLIRVELKIQVMTRTFDHVTQINIAKWRWRCVKRPWRERAGTRQTYMAEGGAIIWQNRRPATGYSCVSPAEPGETQYPAVYRSAAKNTAHHADVSPRPPRPLSRDKRAVPVKAPGLHVDLFRDSVSSVRTSLCRRTSSSESSTRRNTPRWMEFYTVQIIRLIFIVNLCEN